jgi:glucose/arabinose dehydrogenase
VSGRPGPRETEDDVPHARAASSTVQLALGLALLTLALPSVASGRGGFEAIPLPGQFGLPVALAFTPDGTILVVEKQGRVRVHRRDSLQAAPFLDLSDEVNNQGDRGLLGIALHPGFVPDAGPTSWVYLLYTVSPVFGQDWGFDQDNRYSFSRLTRYRARLVDGSLVADPGSRHVILGNQQPDGVVPDGIASLYSSHSNGSMFFAPDGSLFLATGDGAHFLRMDPGGLHPAGFEDFVHPTTGLRGPMRQYEDSGAFRSQDLRSLAGKILRIDPETGLGLPSNPFFDADPASNASRVWALGLRNPFRMSLRPVQGTGSGGQPFELYIGDVGDHHWEEINVSRGGENFGWPCVEGPDPMATYLSFRRDEGDPLGRPDCHTQGPGAWTGPLLTYHHKLPSELRPSGAHVDETGQPLPGFKGNAVTGGVHIEGGSYPPELAGRYLFGDYAQNWIRSLEMREDGSPRVRDVGAHLGRPVDFQRDPLTGDVFFAAIDTGRILRLAHAENRAPIPVAAAVPLFGEPPLEVHFDASGSHDPDGDELSYSWDLGEGSTAAGAAPKHTFLRPGLYHVELTATDPGGRSGTATVAIGVGNTPPQVAILSPAAGLHYEPGHVLALTGTGRDLEDGSASLQWSVDLYHEDHVHPAVFGAQGPSASFEALPLDQAGELHYYRIRLSATDSGGLRTSRSVFVYPAPHVLDVTPATRPIFRLQALDPPHPTGSGNRDPAVLGDGDMPLAGSADLQRQFDTTHGGQQGDDWIGYEMTVPQPAQNRFVSLLFQEGMHFVDGGWFEELWVEVRSGGLWGRVAGLSVSPPYPLHLAGQPFFDGIGFQSYELRFEPVWGDAIRLRGKPGGTSGFVSAAELRVRQIVSLHPDAVPTPTPAGPPTPPPGALLSAGPPGGLPPGLLPAVALALVFLGRRRQSAGKGVWPRRGKRPDAGRE